MRRNDDENYALEMQYLVKKIASVLPEGSKQEAVLHKIAQDLGVSRSRAKTFYHAISHNIRAEEMDRARELADEAVQSKVFQALAEAEQHHLRRAEFYNGQRKLNPGRTTAPPKKQG